MSSAGSEPVFPSELERSIFYFAASFSKPQDISSFLLVCKRVNEWLVPYRLRTIFISKTQSEGLNILSSISPDVLATQVLHFGTLGVNWGDPAGIQHEILCRCTGINDLLLSQMTNQEENFPDLSSFGKLRHLALGTGPAQFFAQAGMLARENPLVLPSLTHLDIPPSVLPPANLVVEQLPALTHFMTHWLNVSGLVGCAQRLAELQQLHVFVIREKIWSGQHLTEDSSQELELHKNPKVIRVLVDIDWRLDEDWLKGQYGEENLWQLAEKLRRQSWSGLWDQEKGGLFVPEPYSANTFQGFFSFSRSKILVS
ncbi:hypothetical protein DL96DRAFT_1576760 [Flagelloscypha sp. PMI_526]|nr:hypothetical protein DL96DRAFT_1576760 [Flagelloscypha sp. PMI_526]